MAGYKSRTIKAILRGKVNAWLKTINDEKLVDALRKDVLITGGSIASMLIGENVKDFDVYLRTRETAQAVAQYYLDIFKEDYKTKHNGTALDATVGLVDRKNLRGEVETVVTIKHENNRNAVQAGINPDNEPEEQSEEAVAALQNEEQAQELLESKTEKRYHPVYISDNAITLSTKVQIVLRFIGEPDVIHQNYDFAHCKNYFDYDKDDLVLNPLALECLLSKTLRYTGSLYPLCSIFRAKKFIERGWRISAGELLKIAYQTSHIDFNNIEQVREQLVGVDALYFRCLMETLIAHVNNGGVVDDHTVMRLVDEVFNM